MSPATVDKMRATRIDLKASQSRLARLSGVSRFEICAFELGSGSLSPDENRRVWGALQAEAEQLRNRAAQIANESSADPTETV